MHQIQKQIIEIDLPDGSDAFSWQEKITAICNETLNEKLGILFDNISKETLQLIDKIEIELGIINIENFENDFIQNIENQLFIKLNAKLIQERKDKKPIENIPLVDTRNIKSNYVAFLYFLENGTLPWWTSNNFLEEIDYRIDTIFSKNQVEQLQQIVLFKKILENPKVIERLVLQFSEERLWQFIHLIFIEEKNTVSLLQKLYEILKKTVRLYSFKNDLDALKVSSFTIFFEGINSYKSLTIKLLYERILIMIIPKLFTNQSMILNFKHAFEKKLQEDFREELSKQNFREIEDNILFEKLKLSNQPRRYLQDLTDISLNEDSFYIENAGLVLLFPFLKEYLKSCTVSNNEEIFEPDNAVHLLQYLVDFQTETFENQLVLNRILCGLPINFPIKKGFEINDKQKEQAETLLKSVIKYWSIMKNTSINGLQISFLRRNGKLTKNKDGWLLQVEQAPYDMLLDELPWTYSVVSLPWMTGMILVEWS